MSNLGFLTKEVIIESQKYIINDKNPYCGFWIYDKLEFNKFVDSKYYDIRNVNGYDIRAVVAIGLHGVQTDWYKATVIPLKENKLDVIKKYKFCLCYENICDQRGYITERIFD